MMSHDSQSENIGYQAHLVCVEAYPTKGSSGTNHFEITVKQNEVS